MAARSLPQTRPANRLEIMIGRGLAVSTHPSIAWPVLSTSKRALMVVGYFAASYVVVLGALKIWGW